MASVNEPSPVNIKVEAIDIDHRIKKQQYTTLFPLNETWVVERPVVWHANKKIDPLPERPDWVVI